MGTDQPWTIQMLASELMTTRSDLMRHIQGCEEGQRQNTTVIMAMSTKLDGVVGTVNGYQRVISTSWTGVGRVLIGVFSAVAAAVAVLALQNADLHKQTATKVETAATNIASVTANQNKTLLDDLADHDRALIAAAQSGHQHAR